MFEQLERGRLEARTKEERPMTLKLNGIAPDFTQDTTDGPIHFHDWIEGHWVVLFSHPKDFTPVCTTELGAVAKLKPEFDKRGVKVIGLSVDAAGDHDAWSKDIAETQGYAPNFPMIADTDLKVSKLYGMLPADEAGTHEGRTAATNATVRNVFIIGPDKRIKLILVYPMTTGRNFDEILRVIDSMQLTARHKVATPADWKQGEDVIITGAVSDEEARTVFPGFTTHKPYLRTTKQPA
jgi:alkyl hydroperoxide reductase subunit AhpC